ncbi:MAG TPA: sulfatase [Desulfobulbaceae bacterium]|nr:sulfatase [Desulfobulbaceae bacterium]
MRRDNLARQLARTVPGAAQIFNFSLSHFMATLRSLFFSLLCRRHGGVFLFFLVFIGIAQAVRLALLCKSAESISLDVSLAAVLAWGLLFDIGTAALFSLPLTLLLTALPRHSIAKGWLRGLAHLAAFCILFVLLFGALAEWVFWDEFAARFNFIAVDYLIYTTEVIENIRESYPLPQLISGLIAVALIIHLAIVRIGLPRRWFDAAAEPLARRLATGALWLTLPLLTGLLLNERMLPEFSNNYHRELAKNGIWSFVAAFRDNELDYRHFYSTIETEKAFALLNRELERDGAKLIDPTVRDTLRLVGNGGEELLPNVIQITVESLSVSFLGAADPQSSLTPNLDALIPKSLVFDNFYATGTRTDRGMEALTLSLPPTPGRSLVKRPRNEHLFTMGSVFRTKGYDTAFIYGGYGYFDNMNYFFGNNGYRVVDRNSVAGDDVTFANAWGACDEDLFRWTLREADAGHAAGKPFNFFVMTTSNHRPYTFPDGRIDLPSKTSGRRGAVKYTDYAIGQLLRQASTRPWFHNTVFVIVADHCASSAGKVELPIKNYHIPLIIYAPGGQITPGHIKTLASQMDFAPTLFGLLNWNYASRFFGHDVSKVGAKDAHALVGNYQKVGHLEQNVFTVLKPLRKQATYHYDFATDVLRSQPENVEGIEETVSYYQIASDMYQNGTYQELSPEEHQSYLRRADRKEAVRSIRTGLAVH